MASVGRMTINLKKKVSPSKWVRLTKNRKKPNNLHYWFEIHEKYSAEMEKMKDDEDDDEDQEESKVEKTNTTTSSNATVTKKKSKKEKRAERVGETEEEKEKARENQWLKTQLADAEERAKGKKKEIDDECRQKKKVIDDETEKEKENLRTQFAEKLHLLEEKYKSTNTPPALEEEL